MKALLRDKFRRRTDQSGQGNQNQEFVQREALLRPPTKTTMEKFRDFFWDRKQKMCLTRTPINWLSISIFYVCFLAIIIFIFALAMLVTEYLSSLNQGKPAYMLADSPIGTFPALNYFPLKQSLPILLLSDSESYEDYVDKITSVFESYQKMNSSYDRKALKKCGEAPYGYNAKAPCVYFRLNRLLMWKPKPYKKGDKTPEDMPEEIKKLIEEEEQPKVWLHCAGTTAKDRDHMTESFFDFQTARGFDPSPYPYNGEKDFIDPIVAVKLSSEIPKKTIFSFTCTAWSKEINPKKCQIDVICFFE